MLRQFYPRALTAVASASVTSIAAAVAPPIVGPPIQLDASSDTGTPMALEYAGVADGLKVVGLWMQQPNDDDALITIRRAWSEDGGVAWTLDNFHNPNTDGAEFDPVAAFDALTETFLVGATRTADAVYLARRGPHDSGFGPSQWVFTGANQAHKPGLAAGPMLDDPNATRIYVTAFAASDDLYWSDDLGNTWSSVSGTIGVAWPRITSTGELIISRGTSCFHWNFARVVANHQNGSPVLEQHTFVDWGDGGTSLVFPGTFDVINPAMIAVNPHDGNHIFGVYWAGDPPDGNVAIPTSISSSARLTTRWHRTLRTSRGVLRPVSRSGAAPFRATSSSRGSR